MSLETEIKEFHTAVKEFRERFERKSRQDGARIDALETVLNRPGVIGAVAPYGETDETKAFNRFVRKGKEGLSPDEFKALVVSDNPAWGYLCPPEVSNEIIKGITEFSPIRQIARVRSIKGESLETPKKTGRGSAYWISETGTRVEVTGLTYGMEKSIPYEMAYLAMASVKSLEDSAYNVEDELNQEFADAFAVLEGTVFVNGTGAQQPEGLLTNASVPTYNSEDADDITADSILALPFQLKSGYLAGARYLLNRTSLWKIRTFKDAVSGSYLWQPAMGDITPATICGFPYTLCPDLADPDTDTYPVLFGNFQRGYLIVDRITMSVLRLDQPYATIGQVGFLARRRVGGHVVLPEAIIKLKCAVTA